MKNLLIILISILLLSSPVIGDSHKGETLYGWGECTETTLWSCDYVWKGFGDKDTHTVYQGEVENGVPNGLGVMIFPSGGKYVGSWENGKMNGKGTYTWSNGEKYEGVNKDGKPWNGTLYDENGNIGLKIVNGKVINQ
ncbi:cytoplasmic protein [bacterium]|nr:cytoplasmic protein [bacterium]